MLAQDINNSIPNWDANLAQFLYDHYYRGKYAIFIDYLNKQYIPIEDEIINESAFKLDWRWIARKYRDYSQWTKIKAIRYVRNFYLNASGHIPQDKDIKNEINIMTVYFNRLLPPSKAFKIGWGWMFKC